MKKIIFLFVFCLPVYSHEYICPKLPARVNVGQKLNHDWYIWPKNEKNNVINKYYYKFFPMVVNIKYWGSFPSGNIIVNKVRHGKFIACCMLLSDNKKRICAYKNIKENNCKPNISGPGPDRFICKDKD